MRKTRDTQTELCGTPKRIAFYNDITNLNSLYSIGEIRLKPVVCNASNTVVLQFS